MAETSKDMLVWTYQYGLVLKSHRLKPVLAMHARMGLERFTLYDQPDLLSNSVLK